MPKGNNKNFLQIFHNNLVGMIITDEHHVIIDINDNLLHLSGRERKDVIGKTGLELGILNEKFVKEIWEEFNENKKVLNRELSFTTKNNKKIHTLFSTEGIQLEGKQYWFTTVIDITERKNAENKMTASELRFRTLTKGAPVGIFETDAKGKTTYVNEAWMLYTGLSLEEAMGDTWMNIIHPEDREKQVTSWYRKTEKAEPSFSEYRIINKSGELRWVNGKAIPLINADGTIAGYIGTISDVTELKQSEEALNKAQNISKTGSWELNLLTSELKWSKEQYRIFEMDEHPGETLYEAYKKKYHPDDLHKLDEIIKYAIDNVTGFSFEHRIICNDGGIKYILGIGEVVLDVAGKVVGLKGTGQDITERKQIEEILNERTEQLRELSTHLQKIREEERTTIAREIHDELGQQLTGIKMDIAWLKKKINPANQHIKNKFEDTIQLIDSAVKSIRRIATELRPSIIDDLGLNAAIEWQLNEFGERLGVEIQCQNNFDDAGVNPNISIGLFRILQESLTNIAKHAKAKKVVIDLTRVRDNMVQLTIQDDGVGFNSSSKQMEITFGLLGIKERTYMMKGECSIYSRPGKGTKIGVRIPLK